MHPNSRVWSLAYYARFTDSGKQDRARSHSCYSQAYQGKSACAVTIGTAMTRRTSGAEHQNGYGETPSARGTTKTHHILFVAQASATVSKGRQHDGSRATRFRSIWNIFRPRASRSPPHTTPHGLTSTGGSCWLHLFIAAGGPSDTRA